jgi:hypothetical protein
VSWALSDCQPAACAEKGDGTLNQGAVAHSLKVRGAFNRLGLDQPGEVEVRILDGAAGMFPEPYSICLTSMPIVM